MQSLAAALPEHAREEVEVAEGAQGPRVYRFARLRVWESRDGLPGRACWLLMRTDVEGGEGGAEAVDLFQATGTGLEDLVQALFGAEVADQCVCRGTAAQEKGEAVAQWDGARPEGDELFAYALRRRVGA